MLLLDIGSSLFFFFSSRRRHTRSLCDWSSDVCSSDLLCSLLLAMPTRCHHCEQERTESSGLHRLEGMTRALPSDRKSVVKGKSVDLGGRRIIKKKNRKSEMSREEVTHKQIYVYNYESS